MGFVEKGNENWGLEWEWEGEERERKKEKYFAILFAMKSLKVL